jgi:hypothetical protein
MVEVITNPVFRSNGQMHKVHVVVDVADYSTSTYCFLCKKLK